MSTLIETYNFVFTELSDPRTHNWPLIAQPWPLMGIIAAYLYIIYVYLPAYMADKKPYSLKGVIAVYNVFQVVACSILMYGLATSGWTTHYTLGCQTIDYSEDKLAVRMASYMWWYMMLKVAELIETAFFVLRKKNSQASLLHVYHHASTFLMAWIACKYFGGGLVSFTELINCFIHVLMYTYYLLSSFGPEMQKKLDPVKSKLTLLQMIQLCIMLIHISQAFLPGCQVSSMIAYIHVPNLVINIMLFIKFYVSNYLKKRKSA